MTTAAFGERMREAREARKLSVENATFAARAHLPEALWFSHQTLRRMENGDTPESKADPFLVGVMAHVYGVPLSVLSPVAVDALRAYSEQVISEMRWITVPHPEQTTLDFSHAA